MFQHDEYIAVQQHAGIIDLSDRGRIALRGRDRLTFLHALLTNDIAALAPGAGCYAAMLNAQGRMIADMLVVELGDVTLVDTHRDVKDEVLAKFDQLIFTEDVQLGDVSDAWTALSVQGPASAAVLGRALAATGSGTDLAADLDGWQPYQNRRVMVGDEAVVVARVEEFRLPGFRVYAGRELMAGLRVALEAAGGVEVGPATADTLRIEAGVPAFRVDMTGDTIPLEAGIEQRAVSFTKGCYPGQEVIVRIVQRGHGRVLRKLTGLRVEGDVVPDQAEEVFAGDKSIGHVTSACHSPKVGGPIALGYVHRDFLEPGTTVTIAHAGKRLGATVAALPFEDEKS